MQLFLIQRLCERHDRERRTESAAPPGRRPQGHHRRHFSPEFSHRLSALGLRVGEMIEVVRRAPFAGPLHLRIGTTDVIMRRQDAAGITVVFA